jgi:hypothetical protein
MFPSSEGLQLCLQGIVKSLLEKALSLKVA